MPGVLVLVVPLEETPREPIPRKAIYEKI